MNTNYIRIIAVLAYVILAPILGAFFDGLDRKISARMQRRVGPPITQPLHDLKKLFAKENVNVNLGTLLLESKIVFIGSEVNP